MAGVRASAQARYRRVEAVYPDLQGSHRVGDAESAGVVEMEADGKVGEAGPDGVAQSLDALRACPGHGVRQRDLDDLKSALVQLGQRVAEQRDDRSLIHPALEVAAEGGRDADCYRQLQADSLLD